MKKLFYFIILSINIPVFSATPREKIESACTKYTDEEIIQNKAPKCRTAVTNYLKGILKNKIERFDRGLYAYLFLGLRADIPEAFQVIEKEIYDGHLNEWVDKLEELKAEEYEKSLIKWARHVETEVRKIYKAELSQTTNYSEHLTQTESSPDLMTIWSPILMTKYLNLLQKKSYHITSEDFESLNVVYAFSNASFREVFRDQTSKVILKASDEWVKSVRKEPAWVLFRIFPLIPRDPDGNIKRELIWLGKYHQDYKIRSLASSTLSKVARVSISHSHEDRHSREGGNPPAEFPGQAGE